MNLIVNMPVDMWLLTALIALGIWSYFWKIIGLWFSAKNNEKGWFVVFVFLNLVGILEIYYLRTRRLWPFNPRKRQLPRISGANS